MKVDYFRHNLGEEEIQAFLEVIKSPFLTTGPKTAEFEAAFTSYLQTRHSVAVSSCTAGLFLALKALGIGPGDEVIVPPLTFIATANVVLHCGAKVVFADVEEDTGLLSLSATRMALSPRTKAIIPVHLYGQMVDMKGFRQLADEQGLKIIEDCAHAIEARRDNVGPGQLGDLAVFSFYATKNITCGEGGAITTNSSSLYETLRLLRQHGMSKSAADRYHGKYQHWDMLELGYKFNLPDIQSCLLLSQLKKIDQRWQRRQKICQRYEEEFSRAEISFPLVVAGAKSARHLFTVWAPTGKRDLMLAGLQERGIGVAVNYRSIHLLTYFQKHFGYEPGSFPKAEAIGERTVSLPLFPDLTAAEIDYVVTQTIDVFKNL